MNNQEQQTVIKKDNHKAFWKLLLTCVMSLVVGGLIGFGIALVRKYGLVMNIRQVIHQALIVSAPFWPLALGVLTIPPMLLLYGKAKKMYRGWDGEDEDLPDQINRVLNRVMVILVVVLMINLVPMGVALAYFEEISFGVFMLIMIVSFAFDFLCVYIQKLVVDMIRTMCPEKKGSAMDMKFQQKYYQSCDEAEKKIIGEASFRSIKIVNCAGYVLFLVCGIMNLLTPIGLTPAIAVLILLGISNISLAVIQAKIENKGKL